MYTSDMLSTFVLVAERASFTAAAEEGKVAKGVVSKRIVQLEQALGHALFRRTTRSVHLTPAGEMFLVTARKILSELEAGSEALSLLRSEPSGVVRITAPVSWGTEVLAKLLPKCLLAFPKIDIELVLTDSLMDLAHEKIDIALRMTPSPSPDQVAIPLVDIERLLCASPKYIKAHGAPKSPAELIHYSCLGYWSDPAHHAWTLLRKNERKTIAVPSRYRVNNPHAVKDAVTAGMGIGLLPDYVCTRELRNGKLKQVLPEWRAETQFGSKVCAVGLPERIRLARCQAVLAFLKETLPLGRDE